MKKLPFIMLCTLMLCFVSCRDKHDPVLEEAFEVHQQSMEIAKETRDLMDKLPITDSSRMQLEARFKLWNENIIEVPGFEHAHHHGDGHDHHHHHNHSKLELLPEDMLLVQKEFLDSMQVIRTQVKSLVEE